MEMPFWFASKGAQGHVGHCILVPRDVQRCNWTDFVYVEPECEDADELLGHQARATRHALYPADRGAVVAKNGYPFFREGTTSVLHHEPQYDQAGEFEVRIGDGALWVRVRDDVGRNIRWPLQAEDGGRTLSEFANNNAPNSVARCIYHPDIVGPPCDEFSAACRSGCGLSQEGTTIGYARA